MGDVTYPSDLGPLQLAVHVPGDARPTRGSGARLARAIFVGAVFSVVPVLLTSLVLTRSSPTFDPRALIAAIPVFAVAFSLHRPRDRWYAVGSRGFALGERYFGDVRWERVLYADVKGVEVEVGPDPGGRSSTYRFVFDAGARRRVVIEGDVPTAGAGGGSADEDPADADTGPVRELRAARAIREAWESAARRRAEEGPSS